MQISLDFNHDINLMNSNHTETFAELAFKAGQSNDNLVTSVSFNLESIYFDKYSKAAKAIILL